jgi:hypothetical protein
LYQKPLHFARTKLLVRPHQPIGSSASSKMFVRTVRKKQLQASISQSEAFFLKKHPKKKIKTAFCFQKKRLD